MPSPLLPLGICQHYHAQIADMMPLFFKKRKILTFPPLTVCNGNTLQEVPG